VLAPRRVALLAAADRFAFYVLDLAPIADVVVWGAFALGVVFGARHVLDATRSAVVRRASHRGCCSPSG